VMDGSPPSDRGPRASQEKDLIIIDDQDGNRMDWANSL
jgi:hypothetical protein